MSQNYRDPDFFRFATLARKLNITQSRIEDDFKTGKIHSFKIDILYKDSVPATKRRIARFMPILNKYAREHLYDGPVALITTSVYTDQFSLKESQKKLLTSNINSESIFKIWLKVFGINIDEIRIVIPLDEALRYENYLKMKDVPVCNLVDSADNSASKNDFRENDYIAQKREAIGCKSNSCYNCDEHECRNQIAHEMSTKYGYETPYRFTLLNIGIAMGCPSPKQAEDKEIPSQREREKKEVGIVKSQVRRWKTLHTAK